MKLSLSVLGLGVTSALAASASVCPHGNTRAEGSSLQALLDYKKSDHQLMAAYYRTWRDTAVSAANKVSMDQLPDCLDIAFVFDSYTEGTPFYKVLNETYVPALHKRGTKVLITTGINSLLSSKFPNTPDGHHQLAKHLIDTNVTPYGLDGLDVDVEQGLSHAQVQQASGVFAALSKLLHDQGKLLVYDTNQNGNTALFQASHKHFDYVLVQSYGRSTGSLQYTWNSYSRYISPKKYLVGFSFYEENDGNWRDATAPIDNSRASQFARWQPSGARKGGVFSYAIDRDGVAHGDNTIRPTDFSWTRRLISMMNP